MLKKTLAVLAMFHAALAMAAIDVNKASEAELDGIKGIGPATSQLILNERKKSSFKDWSDLMSRVKGVGEARASKLSQEGLTVGGAAFNGTGGNSKHKDDKPFGKAAKPVKAGAAEAAK